jgi:futalosine hydrolase
MRPLRECLEKQNPPFTPNFVITGIGKINAAAETAMVLRDISPCLTIQVGSAGAFPAAALEVGDVVVSNLELLGDEGVQSPAGFLDLSDLGFPVAHQGTAPIFNEIPLARPRFEDWSEILRRVAGRFTIRCGRTVTLSTASGTDHRSSEIALRWDPLAESMEGAAAALVALRQGCRFMEVRGISNQVGDRKREAWDVETASDHAAEVALHILDLETLPPEKASG